VRKVARVVVREMKGWRLEAVRVGGQRELQENAGSLYTFKTVPDT